jgi:hypothetical protein
LTAAGTCMRAIIDQPNDRTTHTHQNPNPPKPPNPPNPPTSFIAHTLPDPPTLPPIALRDPTETATLAQRLREGWQKVLAHVPPDGDASTRDYSVYIGMCVCVFSILGGIA